MEEILADKELMAEIQKVYADFKAYINVKPDKTQPSVAYFSMEYGLTNCIKDLLRWSGSISRWLLERGQR